MPKVFQAHCACGRVVFEGKGEPLSVLACYCDDCQEAGKQIGAMPPSAHSGLSADGGSINVLFRKDLVRCASGEDLLVEHKLKPGSDATRMVASCCNSNMSTQFDGWFPATALRTHSVNVDDVKPALCIFTKFAPDASKIMHDVHVPRYQKASAGLVWKLIGAAAYLAFPWSLSDVGV